MQRTTGCAKLRALRTYNHTLSHIVQPGVTRSNTRAHERAIPALAHARATAGQIAGTSPDPCTDEALAYTAPWPASLRDPWREGIKLAELLRELERLGDDTLLARIISALDKAAEREVLAQRVTLEAIVGKDSPQVGVALCTRTRACGGARVRGGENRRCEQALCTSACTSACKSACTSVHKRVHKRMDTRVQKHEATRRLRAINRSSAYQSRCRTCPTPRARTSWRWQSARRRTALHRRPRGRRRAS